MDTLIFLAAPFAACLVLVGIHSYLGQHVLRRQVIFVDLALAQIAALGSVVAFVVGLSPESFGASAFSLAFAVIGAALFAVTRARHETIPQEAIIGMTFVVASAAAILVADRAPDGAEHIKETLAGSILWVGWPDVAKSAAVYAMVGAFHFVFRHKFILISDDPAEAYRRGMRVWLWDFAFYVSFGVVITLSVRMAGILMVFSYLVMPAAMAILLARGWGKRLAVGYVMGTVGSLLGFVVSYRLDMPSGPAVVCSLAALLVLTGVWHGLVLRGRGWTAIGQPARVALVAGVVAIVALAYAAIRIPTPAVVHREAHPVTVAATGAPGEHTDHAAEASPATDAAAPGGGAGERLRTTDACTPLVVLRPGETAATLARDCYGRDVADALLRHNELVGQLAAGSDPLAGDLLELPPLDALIAPGARDDARE